MSSPPTTDTSTKAGILHYKENTSSFPLFSTLNPFRKKPVQPSLYIEKPYEVAPGIWSTDATAKVFGYVDTDDKKPAKTGSRSTGPDDQRSPTSNLGRRPWRTRGLINQIIEAHRDNETDEFRDHPYRLHVEARERSREARLEDARQQREENKRRNRRGRMRTVSREDELIERAANPRTGIVSPFVTSEDSSRVSLETDYIALRRTQAARNRQKRTVSSGRWKQDSAGWSIVESPVLSPIAQSISDRPSREVSVKVVEGKLPPQMPAAKNSEPNYKTNEDIVRYQESIEQACKRSGGANPLIDPDTLPSPRPSTSGGPSSPPTKLQKIPRKEIGSSEIARQPSNETVVVNAKLRARSLPAVGHFTIENQQVRIITPSQTALNELPREPLDENSTFLGQRSPHTPIARGTQFRPTVLQPDHPQPSPTDQRPQEPLSNHPLTSPTLSQFLPRLHLVHPSQISNVATSSYRRPAQVLPPRLRPLQEKRRAVEDACIITTTTTSMPKKDQRPRLQRQDGIGNMRDADQQYLNRRPEGQHLRQQMMRSMQPSLGNLNRPTMSASIGAGLSNNETQKISQKAPPNASMMRDTINMGGAEAAARATMHEESRIREVRGGRHSLKRELSPRDVNVVRDAGQGVRDTDGSTRTYGHPGETALDAIACQNPVKGMEKKQLHHKKHEGHVSEGGFSSKVLWEDDLKHEDDGTSSQLEAQAPVIRRRSIIRKPGQAMQWLELVESWVQTSVLVAWAQQKLWDTCSHVVSAVRRASTAMSTLRSSKGTPSENLGATRDVILAGFYLLLLTNLCMTLGRAFLIVLRVVYWISHPFLLLSEVLRWCLLG